MKLIGRVGSDSSLLMIGDPLFLLESTTVGKSFSELQNKLKKDTEFLNNTDSVPVHKLRFRTGHDGLGLVIDTNNDGIYPVFLDVNETTGETSIIIKLFKH